MLSVALLGVVDTEEVSEMYSKELLHVWVLSIADVEPVD